jgi:hypothetical protein
VSPLRTLLLLPFVAFTIATACGTATTGGGGGSGTGGAGQCVAMGATCDPQVDIGPDGGQTIVQPTCCEGQCAVVSCCYSGCQAFCVPEGNQCCGSGAQCGEDSQCCSGTCAHQDAAGPGFGPGGTCM